jgi:UPF0042 nucleotide-binding protein
MMPNNGVSTDMGASHCDGPSEMPPPKQRVLVVTGLSGAGKTTALKALEDHGYESVDNVPLSLLVRLLRPSDDEAVARDMPPLAVGVDVRTRGFSADALLRFVTGRRENHVEALALVFLHCDDEELRRRYTVTRRRHPLAGHEPIETGIQRERRLLAPIRQIADLVVDTSDLTPGELKLILNGHFGLAGDRGLVIHVISFSFRSGVPREADLVFDVRFLANPHYEPELKPLTGLDTVVGRYVAADPMCEAFFDSLMQLLDPLIPRYAAEGKSYLTIAVGCTGGRHRSVYAAERLATRLGGDGRHVDVYHRDLMRSGTMASGTEVTAGAPS